MQRDLNVLALAGNLRGSGSKFQRTLPQGSHRKHTASSVMHQPYAAIEITGCSVLLQMTSDSTINVKWLGQVNGVLVVGC